MSLLKWNTRNILAIGGVVAAVAMAGSGAASIYTGIDGRDDVRDTLRREQIHGPEDSTIPGQLVDTGSEARAQADIMREHQLKATNGLTYAQMGRFAVEDGNPAGTNNVDEAAKDANGNPIANAARASWVTETALTTSLETAYFAEQVGLFAIVVGTALVLSGIGFGVLTFAALWHAVGQKAEEEAAKTAAAPTTMAPV